MQEASGFGAHLSAEDFLLETKLRELGAKVETKDNFTAHAVRDGNLITGQNPASSEMTAKLLIETLSEGKKLAEALRCNQR